MRITRYIIREIATPFLVLTTFFAVIFAAYASASFLTDVANDKLQPGIISYLIFLKLITVLDVILPSALFYSVIFGLGRLYRDAEMTAFMAAGFSEWQLLRSVLYFALIVALLACMASNVGRPWAFRINYALQARALAELDIGKMQAGRFQELKRSNQVLFAQTIDAANERLHNVYMQDDTGSGTNRGITARSLQWPKSDVANILPVTFENGSIYLLDDHGDRDRVIEFETLTLPLIGGVAPVGYKRKAADTYELAHSDKAGDIAELQWRLATPVTTIMLALLGTALIHTSPRQGRHTRIILAIIVYALLFNLFGVAHSLVEQGHIPSIPGIWWFYVLPLVLLCLLLVRPVRIMKTRVR